MFRLITFDGFWDERLRAAFDESVTLCSAQPGVHCCALGIREPMWRNFML